MVWQAAVIVSNNSTAAAAAAVVEEKSSQVKQSVQIAIHPSMNGIEHVCLYPVLLIAVRTSIIICVLYSVLFYDAWMDVIAVDSRLPCLFGRGKARIRSWGLYI